MAEPPLGRIHLIADLDILKTLDDPLAVVTALLEAGLPSLSLRGKGRDAAALAREGRELQAAARDHRALFIVNGPREAVDALRADGWHLPAAAPPPPPGFELPWGRSAHDAAELAAAAGASWVFVSPVFATASKPGVPGLRPAGLAELVRRAGAQPVYALGGVTRANAPTCVAAGAAGVAAIRGLLGPDGPAWVRATRKLRSDRS